MELRLSGGELALDNHNDDDDDHFAPISYLSDEGTFEPTQVLADRDQQNLQQHGLLNALEQLDERSRRIVQARWLHDDKAATLHELADEFGVSAERIRQIEAAALKKMRGWLAA